MQQIAGEQHPLVAGIKDDASMSGRVARSVSKVEAGRHLAIVRRGVELSGCLEWPDHLGELAHAFLILEVAHPRDVGLMEEVPGVGEPGFPPAGGPHRAPSDVVGVDVREDHVPNVVRCHTDGSEFVRQRAADAEPSADSGVGRTCSGVDQRETGRRPNEEAVNAETPALGGEVLGVRRGQGPAARRRIATSVEQRIERHRCLDVEDGRDLGVPDRYCPRCHPGTLCADAADPWRWRAVR